MSRPPTLLGAELGPVLPALERAFVDAGWTFVSASGPQAIAAAIERQRTNLVVLRGECETPLVSQVLRTITANAAIAATPIVLLADDTTDQRFVKGLRTGIVELLPTRLPAPAYAARLRALAHELPQRPGRVVGGGDQLELFAFFRHLRETFRSGALRINPGTRQAGFVLLVHGEVHEVRFGELTGDAALGGLGALVYAEWTFTELGGGGGEGAGVVLEVPVRPTPAPTPGPRPRNPTPPPMLRASPRPQRAKLLVVDEDPGLGRLFTKLFEPEGFVVTTAPDGFAGFEAAATERCDLVLADLRLPRLDGWGMLRLLREDWRTREVPLAFITRDDAQRDLLAKVETGAQAFLPKDLDVDALSAQLLQLLEPRLSFRRDVLLSRGLRVQFGVLGPQWTLRELARAGLTGRVSARDAWASYALYFVNGELVHAHAGSGQQEVTGERALMAWALSREPVGTVDPGRFEAPRTLHRELGAELDRITAALNARDRNARIAAQSLDADVEVHSERYEMYVQIAPPTWQSIARLVCREGVPPKQIASRSDLPPADVQEALRDLFRRGVVTLRGR